jgi:tetrapyrrole methylase family protein/MazG family protein
MKKDKAIPDNIPTKKYQFGDLLQIMETLRAPGGCPWDIKQTHESILDCLVEEAHEYIDAVLNKDMENMKEELGDILLQVVFHSQMAKEEHRFNIDDVIQGISEKLIYRHPHVFAKDTLDTAEEVKIKWEELKAQEKAEKGIVEPKSALSGVSNSLPPLPKAEKLQKKAAKVGFEWPDAQGPLDKLKEELQEFREAVEQQKAVEMEAEFGDLLFSMVNVARHFKINPSVALERTNLKFRNRFEQMEGLMETDNVPLNKDTPLEVMDSYWEKVKRE